MLTVTSAQLDAWLALRLSPGAHPGLVGAAPVFGNNAVPRRIKLVVGLAVGVGLAAFASVPAVPLDSWAGMLILFQQTLIGIAMGLVLRVVFAALDLMGESSACRWASPSPPSSTPSGGQTAVVGEFLTLLATLVFLSPQRAPADDGRPRPQLRMAPDQQHPAPQGRLAGPGPLRRRSSRRPADGAAGRHRLLITNIALGILTRAAPQLNLFAIGFPITPDRRLWRPATRPGPPGPLLQRFYDMGFDTMATSCAPSSERGARP
jgi:flagellar biosynthetic protein FliR